MREQREGVLEEKAYEEKIDDAHSHTHPRTNERESFDPTPNRISSPHNNQNERTYE